MIKIFGIQYLADQPIKNSDEIAHKYFPEMNRKDLPATLLRLLKEVSNLAQMQDEVIDITCDGMISGEKIL